MITPTQMGRVLINGHAYIRPVIRVAVVTVDGTSCVVSAGDLLDTLDTIDDGGEYVVQIKSMSLRAFEKMPEFNGW